MKKRKVFTEEDIEKFIEDLSSSEQKVFIHKLIHELRDDDLEVILDRTLSADLKSRLLDIWADYEREYEED